MKKYTGALPFVTEERAEFWREVIIRASYERGRSRQRPRISRDDRQRLRLEIARQERVEPQNLAEFEAREAEITRLRGLLDG